MSESLETHVTVFLGVSNKQIKKRQHFWGQQKAEISRNNKKVALFVICEQS